MFATFQQPQPKRGFTAAMPLYLVIALVAGLMLVVFPATEAHAAGSVWDCSSFYGNGGLSNALAGGGLINIACPDEIPVPGPIEITQDTTIQGLNWGVLKQTSGDMSMFRVHSGKKLTLKNLSLRNGYNYSQGGTIYAVNAQVILDSVVIRESYAEQGGGIFMDGGSLTMINNSYFFNNSAKNGAALFNHYGQVEIDNGNVFNNHAYVDGGVVYNVGGTLKLYGGQYHDNQADRYGGVLNNAAEYAPNQQFELKNLYVYNNKANAGAAVYEANNYPSFIDYIKSSTFENNGATTDGGAVFATQKGLLHVINSTFTANVAAGKGGAFAVSKGTLQLTNDTISANSAYQGGANLYASAAGYVWPANTIIANGGGFSNCMGSTIFASATDNNLQWPGNSCGASMKVADPKLLPLANNGGPTPTMGLWSYSPAINGGKDSTCTSPLVGNVDQRGKQRFSPCDIGAFEFYLIIKPR